MSQSNSTAPQNVATGAQDFAAWFHQNYPYLTLTQEVFDVIAATLSSLNVPMESVSADNYRAAFVLAVNQGKISLPASPQEVAEQQETARQRAGFEAAEAARLAEEKRTRRQDRLRSQQLSHLPGVTSAFGTPEDRAEEQQVRQREAKKIQDAITSRARHEAFNAAVRLAKMEARAETHARKQGKFDQLLAKIKLKFPEPEFTATLY